MGYRHFRDRISYQCGSTGLHSRNIGDCSGRTGRALPREQNFPRKCDFRCRVQCLFRDFLPRLRERRGFQISGWDLPGGHLPHRHETDRQLGAGKNRFRAGVPGRHAHAGHSPSPRSPVPRRELEVAGSYPELFRPRPPGRGSDLFPGDGPHFTVRSASGGRRMGGVLPAFASPHLRAAALGYFGHMRELYSFWTLAPQILSAALKARQPAVPGLAFAITAIGAIGCIAGGGGGPQGGERGPCRSFTGCFRVLLPDCRRRLEATFTLWLSGTAPGVGSRGGCRLSPVFRLVGPAAAPANLVGGVMAIQNSVGFAITIVSIALATSLYPQFGIECRLGLVAGPDTRTYRLLPPVGDT